MKYILQLILPLLFFVPSALADDLYTKVERVVDGDTILTTDGDFVRLLDINTPEISHGKELDQPFAVEAKEELARVLPPQTEIHLIFGDRKKDRYKRLLAHIYTNDGAWINAHMIRKGLAHVYSFPDNAFKAEQLIPIEHEARKAKKGIWQHKRWQILDASSHINDNKIGEFNIVEGRVLHTAYVNGISYLNFGENWRNDFSIEIPHKFLTKFKEKNIKPTEYYKRKKVRVRGHLKPINGVLITATHPEQLTILD